MPKGVYPRHVKRHAVIQPQDQSYKIIALTQGQNTLVDATDYEWLNQCSWTARWNPCTQSFYALRTRKNKTVYMARYILNCGFGEIIDHINHDTLDNRRQNLRKCTGTQNKTNSKIYRNNKSGFKGVHWHKRDGTWGASIGYNGKQIHIGYFATLEEAARAYNETARQLHGEFAYLNAISG